MTAKSDENKLQRTYDTYQVYFEISLFFSKKIIGIICCLYNTTKKLFDMLAYFQIYLTEIISQI